MTARKAPDPTAHVRTSGIKRSLQHRIVASVMLGLGVVLVGFGYLVTVAFNASKEAALHERLAVAQDKAHELQQEIQDALGLLAGMGQDVALTFRAGKLMAVREELQRVLETTGVFSGVVVLNSDGAVAAGAGDPAWPRRLRAVPSLRALLTQGEAGVFEVEAQPPSVGVALPVASAHGATSWLIAELRPSRLGRHLLPEHLSFGAYRAEVLTGGGRVVVASPGQTPVVSSHTKLIAELVRQRRVGTVLHRPERGPLHYVAYVPLAIPLGWGVMIEQPQDVVVALPLRLRRWMIGVGATVLLVGTLVAWFDVRRVITPLNSLTEAARRIGRGDLATPVLLDRDDEMGVLARTLEDMRGRLGRLVEEVQEQTQSVATLQERERIARELHDGLAQALGALHSMAVASRLRLSKGTVDGLEGTLEEMAVIAGQAYEEVRQSIFGLRTMVSRGLGLIPAITEYLHEFSERSGIQVRLVVEEDTAARLGPEAETQLIRIVQEALSNVWRHSRAGHAAIRFHTDGGVVHVVVEDDGIGFDPRAPRPSTKRRFGLQTMRERAETVGGTLQVDSSPGGGTRVDVRLPPDRRGK